MDSHGLAGWSHATNVEWLAMAVILIIDDTDMVRDLLQKSLERVGHDVRAAKDGLEGLRLFNEFPPDVVITDILMPDCDGIEVIQALRKQRPGLKILAISGADGAMDFLRAAQCIGATRTLHKPLLVSTVLKTIEELLASKV
jgi:CheY-like chemotaxis protein